MLKRIALGLCTLALIISCGKKKCSCPDDKPDLSPVVELPIPPSDGPNCDEIYGQCVDTRDTWRAEGGQIQRNGKSQRVVGINWFGLETSVTQLHGLWTGRTIESFVDQVAELKFNSIRVPLSPEALDESLPGSAGYPNPKAQLVALIDYAATRDISILLDMHTCS